MTGSLTHARPMRWGLVLAVVLLSGTAHGSDTEDQTQSSPQPLPRLVKRTLEGDMFFLSDVTGPGAVERARPVVLLFGAHWCVPCHDVVSLLHARRGDLDARGVTRVYVHVDDRDIAGGLTRRELDALATTLAGESQMAGVRVLLAGSMSDVTSWAGGTPPESLPLTVLIRADGAIDASVVGVDGLGERLDAFLAALPRVTVE